MLALLSKQHICFNIFYRYIKRFTGKGGEWEYSASCSQKVIDGKCCRLFDKHEELPDGKSYRTISMNIYRLEFDK